MRLHTTVAAVLTLVFVTTLTASAAPPVGALLDGTIDQNLSSNHAYAGQAVSLSNVTSDDGSRTVHGGRLYGHVSEVQSAGQGRPGKLRLTFTTLVLPSGARYAVSTTVTNMRVETKNNALKEAGGALAGMLVGNAVGKTLFGGSAGGPIGAAGGFLLAKNNRQDVNIPQGSAVQVQLNSVTRRQSQ
jgi:hypothetical protein